MFTGIVREVGRVRKVSQSGDTRIRIGCARPVESSGLGRSMSALSGSRAPYAFSWPFGVESPRRNG